MNPKILLVMHIGGPIVVIALAYLFRGMGS